MEMFVELTKIVFIATGVSIVMRFLKQPLIVGYILSGILAGPYFFNALKSTEFIDILSKIGITILLFIVGLNMSPKVVKEVGKVSVLTGVAQIVFTAIVGYFIAIFLGFSHVASLYISIGLTFSSTIIVLKVLSDKGDLNKLYGKIAIGFLLVQDIVAALILVAIPIVASGKDDGALTFVILFLKAIQIAIVLYLISKYILPGIIKFVANSQELLFLFSIFWGLSMASIFYAYGFSAEIGALVAGVSLSVTPYAYQIGSRLKPLRDFFIILFFVLTGSHIDIGTISQYIVPALIFSLYVLIGNPVIMVIIMRALGYHRKTSFFTGLTVSQISEFSLILASVGYAAGHLSKNDFSLITLVGLITIAGSTYFMLYANEIYPKFENILKKLDFLTTKEEQRENDDDTFDVILFGYDRVGQDFVNLFRKLGKNYLVVDFNPLLIKLLRQENIPSRYGDAEDIEFLHTLHLEKIKMCVSTIPDFKVSSLLLKRIRNVNKSAIVILLTHDIDEAVELYKHGATYVMLPHYLSAKHTVHMIDKLGFDKKEFEEEKEKHLAYIQEKEM